MQTITAGQTAIVGQPSKKAKIAALVISFFVTLFILVELSSSGSSTPDNSPAGLPDYKKYPAASAKEFGAFQSTTTLKFDVKYLNRKKVDSKTRYFFSAVNHSTTTVDHFRLNIELWDKTKGVTSELHAYSLTPEAGALVYLDSYTNSDEDKMGIDLAIRSFKYAFYTEDGYLFATGTGAIPVGPTYAE